MKMHRQGYSKLLVIRRTLHVPNLMQISKTIAFALGSAQVKFDVLIELLFISHNSKSKLQV